MFDSSKSNAFAYDKISVTPKTETSFWNGRKHDGKSRKCWFSLFPQCFQKPFNSLPNDRILD